ncbi:MAG: translation initiation factor IF-2 [Candidatus Dasytiphilus stammeri]
MTNISIKALAREIMMPVDLLIKQLAYIGICKSESDDLTMQEKHILINNLKKKPPRILEKLILKRKKRSTLNISSMGGKSKEVQIEIRKNRTYLKEESVELRVPTEKIIPDGISDTNKHTKNMVTSFLLRDIDQNLNSEDMLKINKNIRREEVKVSCKLEVSDEQEKKEKKESEKHSERDRADHWKKNNDYWQNDSTENDEEYLNTPLSLDISSKYEKNRKLESSNKKWKSESQKWLGVRKNSKNIELKKQLETGKGAGEKPDNSLPINLVPKVNKSETKFNKNVVIGKAITVAELSNRMAVKSSQVIKLLMSMGTMATVNQILDQDTAQIVAEEMGYKVILHHENYLEEVLISKRDHKNMIREPRAPVVTIMGHVDHGKTSLLDYIRSTKITSLEFGGITQHIGAYHVKIRKGTITFLDTPGHAAFTAMRARGVQLTDIVVLVIAADDGIMPQTIEAIQHAQAAQVPIVVAINKIDKSSSDIEQIKNQLSHYNLMPEEWGGDTQYVSISAKTGIGIDELLDAILLQAEMLELTAIHTGIAKGLVIESYLDKGRGPVASVLVREGTLKKGDFLLCGLEYGRVRAMRDELGSDLFQAGPSRPVEILGLSGVPVTGDILTVVQDERKAREVALVRKMKSREQKLSSQKKSSIKNMLEVIKNHEQISEINIVIRADVQGSVEAIVDTLKPLSSKELKVNIVGSGVGSITESDIVLASASQALIIGFNVRADSAARKIIATSNIEIRYYSVIYQLIDEVKKSINSRLLPEYQPNIIGLAEVRNVFRSPKFGAIAGCMVIEGAVKRNKSIRILRDHIVIYEGSLDSLRHFKDDVDEVKNGFECGIGVKNYNDVQIGDLIEVFELQEITKKSH